MATRTVDTTTVISESGLSWASIAGGATAALAITLILLWFGVGMGFSVVSPWSDSGPSAGTFKIGTGLYLIVVAMISSAIGGHIAGRLRSGWTAHPNEIFFRDTANGFLSWALATIVGAMLLGSAASGIIGSASGGLVQVGASAASAQSSGAMASYVDQLLRPSAAPGANNPDAKDTRDELSRLLTASFGSSSRDVSNDDKTYIAQVVAQRTGLNQTDAQKRVDDVIGKLKSNLDAARKAAVQLAFWVVASLLIGAFSASLAASEAGAFRDRNWNTV
jgi:hypothetical protein